MILIINKCETVLQHAQCDYPLCFFVMMMFHIAAEDSTTALV